MSIILQFEVGGGNVLVEADGPQRTLVATRDAGMLYMRGYPEPNY